MRARQFFFRRFTCARTEAESVGNIYTEQSLVNFSLAGLGTSKNAKYDTAIQLYNLERDSRKTYTLEDIEKKFFAIDEKVSREAAKAQIAQGNMAHGQRRDRTHRNRNDRGNRQPRRNGHNKTADANAATDTNKHANLTCYNRGKKGHIVPDCPEKKNGKFGSNSRTAQGNAAHATTDNTAHSPELVCFAHHVDLLIVRLPCRVGPAPAVTVDFYARQFCRTDVFVSLAVQVDETTLSWERERAFQWGHLPEFYAGDLEQLQEPLWTLLHNHPFSDLDPQSARITRSDHHARSVFLEGIIPGLARGYNIKPSYLLLCYRYWHSLVKTYLEYRLENIEQGLNLPVTVSYRHKTIFLTFYPVTHYTPEIITRNRMEHIVHPDDSDEEWEQAFVAISKAETANAVRKKDPSIAEIGDPCNLNNYLPDSGATQHMTPHLADLVDAVKGQNLGVEVADSHVIKCTTTGKIKVRMLDDNGEQLDVTLMDIMYVPGLSQWLFSIAKFAHHGFHTMIKKIATN
jgi:hypothetical protein